MRRLTVTVFLVALPALLLLVGGAGPKAPARDEAKAPAARAPANTTAALLAKLYKRAKFAEVPKNEKTTLRDVLAKLSKDHAVSLEINERTLGAADDAGETASRGPIVARSAIPARETTLARRLQQVLDRLPVPATFAVRSDHVEITTKAALSAQALLDQNLTPLAPSGPAPGGGLGGLGGGGVELLQELPMPLVNVLAERRPLEEVVSELADQVDFNLTIDPRLGEKARTSVTARLLNAPLDSALLVLTEMADLRAVRLDNLFYITTPEKSAKLLAEWRKSQPAAKRSIPGSIAIDDGGPGGT